jgi:ubiquinone/menaquinone biosynthesis C-methylase UbiE
MGKINYNVNEYWSEVANRIKSREEKNNVIAGDDEPFYRHKRKMFLDLLLAEEYKEKLVLEIGCGPGGNLNELFSKQAKRLVGVDISQNMIDLAKSKLPSDVEIVKVNGTSLPFDDQTFDIVFSATVLQHNTDEAMLEELVKEMCRVCNKNLVIYESISPVITGDILCKWRPQSYYINLMERFGFKWESTNFINVYVSYYMAGIIRKLLNSKDRKEGEPLNKVSIILQNFLLPITMLLDKLVRPKKDLAQLKFVKIK